MQVGDKVNLKRGAFSYEARVVQVKRIVYLHLPCYGIVKMRNGVAEGYEIGKGIHIDYETGCWLEDKSKSISFLQQLKEMGVDGKIGHHEIPWTKQTT